MARTVRVTESQNQKEPSRSPKLTSAPPSPTPDILEKSNLWLGSLEVCTSHCRVPTDCFLTAELQVSHLYNGGCGICSKGCREDLTTRPRQGPRPVLGTEG